MASVPITSWQIDGEIVETVTDFIFMGIKITPDGGCSHETRRHLLPGRKAMTSLDSVLKSRDITLPTLNGTGFRKRSLRSVPSSERRTKNIPEQDFPFLRERAKL